MTRKPDNANELPLAARTRTTIPEAFPASRIFPGWGPGLGR